ncbi:MAG: hypothetical protein ACMG6H_09465, partial [Acidobacteriota bacterium]
MIADPHADGALPAASAPGHAASRADAAMARAFRGMAVAALGALLLAGCGTAPSWERLPASPLAITVQPGKFGEECFALAAGERIEYQFAATVPLDFNLHTHRGR